MLWLSRRPCALARSGDRAGVEALLAASGLPLDGLADRFPEGYAVAEIDGALAGAAGVERHGDDGLLRSVAVSPEWRGRGLGERLVRDRLAWAADQGLGTVYLLTTTAPAYFPRVGFRPAERAGVPAAVRASREFSSVCPVGAVLLALRPEDATPSAAGDPRAATPGGPTLNPGRDPRACATP